MLFLVKLNREFLSSVNIRRSESNLELSFFSFLFIFLSLVLRAQQGCVCILRAQQGCVCILRAQQGSVCILRAQQGCVCRLTVKAIYLT